MMKHINRICPNCHTYFSEVIYYSARNNLTSHKYICPKCESIIGYGALKELNKHEFDNMPDFYINESYNG